MFIYHIEEPTIAAVEARVLADFADAIARAAPVRVEEAAGPAATEASAPRTRRTKAEMEAAKAAAAAPATTAAPAAETPPATAAAPARVVTREQVREVMGQMIARHPQKGAAATAFLQEHAKGAKNITSTADADLPVLFDAVVAWLEANPASDPTA
jgi:hypothetical protein